MRKIIATISLMIIAFVGNSTNYYLSNTGSDNNTGTSISSPWKTIAKLNTITYQPGDTIFFKSGDIFRGQITVNQGGNSSSSVVFTAYGNGNKPIISGADTITTVWTNAGTLGGFTYYTTPFAKTPKSFFVNNAEQSIARYPSKSYLTLDSAQKAYLKDASLSSIASNLINGSKICVHSQQWCWELTQVGSLSGNQINFTTATLQKSKDKYGYFLYDNINHLDTINEWKYDGGLIKYIPVSGNPNSMVCLASVDPNGMVIGGSASYIRIINLAFEKQTNAGVLISGSSNRNIKIDNCYFRHQFNYGVNDKGRYNEILNSYFREVDGLAIYVDGNALKSTIHSNTFRNIGPFRNYGVGQEINLSAIKISFRDSCHVHHNDIDSTGYCGVSADGKYNTIERNVVKNAMLKNNDGAALKSFGTASQYNVFKNNFVSLSDGNTEGTFSADFVTPAIYFDFSTNNCTIQDNTIYNITKKGIFQNSANHHNTIIGNVVHRASIGIDFNGSPVISSPYMTNMVAKHNSIMVLDNNSYVFRQVDHSGTNNIGIIDSNQVFQPFNSAKFAFRPGTGTPDHTLSQWKAFGWDTHSQPSFVSWTYPTRFDTLFMNISDNVANINLGNTKYLDLDSNVVCGTLVLQPYTSKILINTNTTCSVGMNESYKYPSIAVFPNPANTILNIQWNDAGSIIQVMDVQGRKVMEIYNLTTNKINIENLEDGIYFINVISKEGKVANVKFVKQ
jgi:hypothetical protein